MIISFLGKIEGGGLVIIKIFESLPWIPVPDKVFPTGECVKLKINLHNLRINSVSPGLNGGLECIKIIRQFRGRSGFIGGFIGGC